MPECCMLGAVSCASGLNMSSVRSMATVVSNCFHFIHHKRETVLLSVVPRRIFHVPLFCLILWVFCFFTFSHVSLFCFSALGWNFRFRWQLKIQTDVCLQCRVLSRIVRALVRSFFFFQRLGRTKYKILFPKISVKISLRFVRYKSTDITPHSKGVKFMTWPLYTDA